MDTLPKNISIFIFNLTGEYKVFLVCKKWNELRSECYYFKNKNDIEIYKLHIDDINDFKKLMDIKTLEDIGEKYTIKQISFLLLMKKNPNLLSKYVKYLMETNNKYDLKNNIDLMRTIVKYDDCDIVRELYGYDYNFSYIHDNVKIMSAYIGRFCSINIYDHFTGYAGSTLNMLDRLRIMKNAAYFKKTDFIKKIIEPRDKNNLIDDFNSLLEFNKKDKSTYSDVFEFLNNL